MLCCHATRPGPDHCTWNTVISAHSNESKFLRSQRSSPSSSFRQNLHPNRFMPRMLDEKQIMDPMSQAHTSTTELKGKADHSISISHCITCTLVITSARSLDTGHKSCVTNRRTGEIRKLRWVMVLTKALRWNSYNNTVMYSAWLVIQLMMPVIALEKAREKITKYLWFGWCSKATIYAVFVSASTHEHT